MKPAVRIVVVVLFDPVAVPAMGTVVVGKRVALEVVAHVGSGLRAHRGVQRYLLDASGPEDPLVFDVGEMSFDRIDHAEAGYNLAAGGDDRLLGRIRIRRFDDVAAHFRRRRSLDFRRPGSRGRAGHQHRG
jgi:hypothetical protein